MLVFVKGRPQLDGKPQATLMFDLSDATEGSENRPAVLREALIDEVAEQYRGWRAGAEPTAGFTAVARFDDLATNDFIIDPRQYNSMPTVPLDTDVAVRKRSSLLEQLDSLIAECRNADEALGADLAELPSAAYEEIRLGDLSSAMTIGKGFPTQRAAHHGDVRVMSVAALRHGSSPKYFADRSDIADVGLELARPGDVLIAVEGGTVGETFVVPEEIDEFVPSQQVATLRVIDTTRLDPWYLGAWLSSEPARQQIRRLARGMAIQRVPIRDLTSLSVMIPPLRDQEEIGRRFHAFQKAIQSHRSAAACLEELRDLDLVVILTNSGNGGSDGALSMSKGRPAFKCIHPVVREGTCIICQQPAKASTVGPRRRP
jgi:hypothetical protein